MILYCISLTYVNMLFRKKIYLFQISMYERKKQKIGVYFCVYVRYVIIVRNCSKIMLQFL